MTEDGATLVAVLRSVCNEVRRQQQYLCDLDAVVGDGDHGLTMTRCAKAIEGRVDDAPDQSVGEILEDVGRAVARSAGGATGPLLGTAFVAAGRALDGAGPHDPGRIAAMLEAAVLAIRERGKANVGDRTMLDALHPASVAARRAAADGSDVAGVVEAAARGADEGARATANMVARAGRSVRMGERALGHPDPGAVSIAIMLRAAADGLGASRRNE